MTGWMILSTAVFRSPLSNVPSCLLYVILHRAITSLHHLTSPLWTSEVNACQCMALWPYDPHEQKGILMTALYTDCKNKQVLSATVKVKRAVMQHRPLCSQLGGLAHSKPNECELKGQLDCSPGLGALALTAWVERRVNVLQNKATELVLWLNSRDLYSTLICTALNVPWWTVRVVLNACHWVRLQHSQVG